MFTPFEYDDLIFFFRGDTRNDVARAQCCFQFFIGEQVEFLLNLTLNVLGTAGTQDTDRPALLISRWMILAPSFIADSKAVSSPVA